MIVRFIVGVDGCVRVVVTAFVYVGFPVYGVVSIGVVVVDAVFLWE